MCGTSSRIELDNAGRTLRGCHLERWRYAQIFEAEEPVMLHHR